MFGPDGPCPPGHFFTADLQRFSCTSHVSHPAHASGGDASTLCARIACAQPLAASDYLKIAHEFHTLIVDDIPVMDFARRNEAKRFIILIDTLYDHAVKLLASAEAPPEQLYTATEGYEANEFKRTASRLFEMRSQSYLGLPHGPRTAENVDMDRIAT